MKLTIQLKQGLRKALTIIHKIHLYENKNKTKQKNAVLPQTTTQALVLELQGNVQLISQQNMGTCRRVFP